MYKIKGYAVVSKNTDLRIETFDFDVDDSLSIREVRDMIDDSVRGRHKGYNRIDKRVLQIISSR